MMISSQIFWNFSKLRNHGLVNRDEANLWGFNSRLDEMQAAFALIKLKKLNMWNEKYIDIAKTYTENLSDKIVKPITKSGYKDVFHNYIIVVPEEIRDDFMNSLHDIGIESKIHYPIPLHLQKCATSLGYKKGDIPNAERLSNSMISLPIYHTLTSNEIEYVVESVNKLVETYL